VKKRVYSSIICQLPTTEFSIQFSAATTKYLVAISSQLSSTADSQPTLRVRESELLYHWRFTAHRSSWRQTPWDSRPVILFSNWTLVVIVLMGMLFTIAAGPRQRNHSQVRVPRDSWSHFTVSDSRLSQHGGPGPRIYISQEQGSPVIPPGTGFPFRHILPLAGLRWRWPLPQVHSTRQPTLSQSQSYFTTGGLPPIISSWRQAPWDPRPEIYFFNWTLAVIVLMWHPLWRDDGFVCYQYAWPFV
jgi:hypothetical protein